MADEKQQLLFTNNTDNQDIPKKKSIHAWYIFIDGAARGNPGPAGAGIYITDENKKLITKAGFFLGKKTNNQAEYFALALAVGIIIPLIDKDEVVHLNFVSDSLLLIKQMKGEYKTKNPILTTMKQSIVKLLMGYHCTFKHVLREYNTKADQLANQGVDKHQALTPSLRSFVIKHNLPSIP